MHVFSEFSWQCPTPHPLSLYTGPIIHVPSGFEIREQCAFIEFIVGLSTTWKARVRWSVAGSSACIRSSSNQVLLLLDIVCPCNLVHLFIVTCRLSKDWLFGQTVYSRAWDPNSIDPLNFNSNTYIRLFSDHLSASNYKKTWSGCKSGFFRITIRKMYFDIPQSNIVHTFY